MPCPKMPVKYTSVKQAENEPLEEERPFLEVMILLGLHLTVSDLNLVKQQVLQKRLKNPTLFEI